MLVMTNSKYYEGKKFKNQRGWDNLKIGDHLVTTFIIATVNQSSSIKFTVQLLCQKLSAKTTAVARVSYSVICSAARMRHFSF